MHTGSLRFAAYPLQDALHRAVHIALVGMMIAAAPLPVLAASLEAPAVRAYKLPPGPLGRTLSAFAADAGIALSFDPALAEGKTSPALVGNYTTREALTRLLAGSGLELFPRNDGSHTLRKIPEAGRGETVLPTVAVKANVERENAWGPVQGYVAKRSATVTKTDTPIIEIPQSISVIGREEMEAHGAQDILEALRYTPGIVVSNWGSDSRGLEWSLIRGFSSYDFTSYRDGLAQAVFSYVTPLTETYGLERIEVLRGPSSVTFGQGDAGGIIHRLSKTPTGERIREVEVQYGNFDRRQLAFDWSDTLGQEGELSARLVGLGLKTNSQDQIYPNGDKVGRTRQYLAPSLRWAPSATTSITFLAEAIRSRAGDDLVNLTDAAGNPTNVRYGDPKYSRFNQDQTSVGYQFEHEFNDVWSIRNNFRYLDSAVVRHSVGGWGLDPDGRTYPRTAELDNESLHQTVVDLQLQGKLRAGDTEHRVLLGADLNQYEGKSRVYTGSAPSLDLLNPVYGVPIDEPTTPSSNIVQNTRQSGIYVQDQIKFDKHWIATLGGRQDQVKTDTDDRLNAAITHQSDSVFSGRAGLTYLFDNGLAPYTSYAESFLPTGGVDVNNQPLKPSRGKQWEIGTKFQPKGMNALFTAAIFDLRKTSVLTVDPLTNDARQIGKVRSRGIELEAKAELMRGLSATAAYTWLDMKVLQSANDVEVNKTPIQVPRQMASLWLDYAMAGGFGLSGGVRYVGRRWNDEANTSSEPGYTLMDAAVSYGTGPWRLALNVNNLFDKNYYASRSYNNYYLGAERTMTASLKYRF